MEKRKTIRNCEIVYLFFSALFYFRGGLELIGSMNEPIKLSEPIKMSERNLNVLINRIRTHQHVSK